jgi:hypothetical protein
MKPITNQNICDILATAFEGGINYWCKEVEVNDWGNLEPFPEFASGVPTNGGTLTLHLFPEDAEIEGAPKPEILGKTAIVRGIRMAADHMGLAPWKFIENHDAGDADMAVQFAVFGELIFG